MMLPVLVLAAVTVLPADRLAMADRLLNRGKYEDALVEYRALVGQQGIAADELIFRIAECDRAAGRSEAARKGYAEIVTKYPKSKHAQKARFTYAMGAKGLERRKLLTELDSDQVDKEIRVAALYYLGSDNSDAEALVKCVRLDPKGKYAQYANLKYGNMLLSSKEASERRKGVEVLLGIGFGGGPLADDALYLAGVQSYRDKRYDEAAMVFRRYLKTNANGKNTEDSRSMLAWCLFLQGKYSDAAAVCATGKSDDLDYVRAACAYSTGDNELALSLFKKYLEDYPKGHYRADAELPVARIEFDAAQKGNDLSKTIESAKRSYGISKLAEDQLRLAWAYEKAGKPGEAAAEYDKIAKNFSGSESAAGALYLRGMLEARADNWSAVELTLAEALATGKLGKRTAEALYWRGVAAVKIGHEAEGVKLLAEALNKGLGLEQSREARMIIADFDFRAGNVEKAKSAYVALIKDGACERMSAARLLAVGKLVGGEAAEACAKALTALPAAEWRQAGWALLGECEERREAFTAAIASYRKCLAEKATTEELASAALRLGKLEARAGEYDSSDVTLKRAITLNSSNPTARADAYVMLAKNAGARGDWQSARAYATVVTSLFGDGAAVAEAKRILDEHPEGKE